MLTDETADLARDLRLAVGRLARRLRRIYEDEDEGEGLRFLELAVLHRLGASGPTSPSVLAGDEGVTGAAIAATLTRLEGQQLVTRSRAPGDGRRVVVAITEPGQRVLRCGEAATLSRIQAVLANRFGTADRTRLATVIPLLEKVANEL